MSHILLGEQAWFQRLDGRDPDRDIWRTLSLETLRDMYTRHDVRYRALLNDDLDRVIEFVRFTGDSGRMSVADVLTHLALHGAHHRGQLATRATAHGIPPVNTDFVQFCLVTGVG